MSKSVIGWDIGGAHVKAVMLNSEGDVQRVSQQACALWKGLDLLEEALQSLSQSWQLQADDCVHAVTMTGELVDLFENRAQGVREIAATMRKHFPNAMFYMVSHTSRASFTDSVEGYESDIASMNWHASAQCLAASLDDSSILVVDIGSTTTDITVCHSQQVLPNGWADAERMAKHGLLYTGVVRTPLMALGPYIEWQQQERHIAAEYFATTADAYRVLDELHPAHDLADTADGQDRSTTSSMRRLARMLGNDLEDADTHTWRSLAQAFKDKQIDCLLQAIQSCIYLSNTQPKLLTGLGAGSFLLPDIARRLNLDYKPASICMTAGSKELKDDAQVCFPAYAVARLWQAWH
jgi:(4-(4-[2-(gamma-L-glutamylamino)ethyl]phenoxymethyl)furan-2-yl)methanamine synthase